MGNWRGREEGERKRERGGRGRYFTPHLELRFLPAEAGLMQRFLYKGRDHVGYTAAAVAPC